jgi:uncharacterized protein YkwD
MHGRLVLPIRVLMLTGVLILTGCAGGPSADKPVFVNTESLPAGASAAAQTGTPLGAAVLKAANAYRATKGVGALAADATLERAAAVHAADMSLRNYFGHHNPEAQGPRERMLAINPEFKGYVAENIQVVEGPTYAAMSDTALAALLVEKWSQSPSHRKNLQTPDFDRSGVGIARSGEKIIAVQVFAAP